MKRISYYWFTGAQLLAAVVIYLFVPRFTGHKVDLASLLVSSSVMNVFIYMKMVRPKHESVN